MDDKIYVYDNVLSPEEHEKLHQMFKRLKWTNFWSSLKGRSVYKEEYQSSWHWNHTFFQAMQNMPAITKSQYNNLITEYPEIKSLWEKVSSLTNTIIGKHNILRLYANCNPYGTNAYVHTDDGDYTAVYYPNVVWDAEWEGGTCFYEVDKEGKYDAIKYVSYKPNRIVIFPARIPHRGMCVDRACTDARYVIAMKLQTDVNNLDYLKGFYDEK